MSYILDALKKDQKSLSSLDFNEEVIEDRTAGEARNNYLSLFTKIAILILLSLFIGFFWGGGYNVLQHNLSEHKAPNITEIISLVDEQPLRKNVNQDDTNVAGYFAAADDYNKQLIANKKFAQMQRQQLALEQYQLEQQQQQELLAKQVQLALAETGVMNNQRSSALKSPLEPAVKKTDQPVTLTLNHDELEGVSPELLLAFQTALDDSNDVSATDKLEENTSKPLPSTNNEEKVKPLGQMPSWYQDSLPTLQFSLHMYTSVSQDSWVRLNGKDYHSGEQTDEGLVIEQILPQKLILQYQGERFSMKALTNW